MALFVMQFAGELPVELLELVARAGEDESQWPSLLRPTDKNVPLYRYDPHMRDYVPNHPMPRRV